MAAKLSFQFNLEFTGPIIFIKGNIYASLEGGKVKNLVRQIYVLINNETANVDYIKKQCEEELNK